jgi:hypothetical protein
MSRLAHWLILCGLYLCGALLAALPWEALAQVATPLPPGREVVEIEGYGFPSQIAGLVRSTKSDFGSSDLGFSVRYGTSQETWADIYVYDDLLDLSAGSLSLAKREVDEAIEGVKALVDQGLYQRAAVGNRSTSGSFAAAHLTIVKGGQERESFVFVTTHKRRFIKIRLTAPSGSGARALAHRFVEEYRRTLKAASSQSGSLGSPAAPLKQIPQRPLTATPEPRKSDPMIARHTPSATLYTPSP